MEIQCARFHLRTAQSSFLFVPVSSKGYRQLEIVHLAVAPGAGGGYSCRKCTSLLGRHCQTITLISTIFRGKIHTLISKHYRFV